MSGWVDRIKGIFASTSGDAVPDALAERLTPKRIDDALDRVPGGDIARDHIPENAGEQIGGAARGFGGEEERPDKG